MRWKRFPFGKLSNWLTQPAVFFATFLALDWPFKIGDCLPQAEQSGVGVLFLFITVVPEELMGWYER